MTIPTSADIPGIIKAIEDGHRIKIFLSSCGMRVVRNEDTTAYGEHHFLSGALAHASESYLEGGIKYEDMYSGKNARHDHHEEGSSSFEDDLDHHVLKGRSVFIEKDPETGEVVVELSHTEDRKLPPEIDDLFWGSDIKVEVLIDGFAFHGRRGLVKCVMRPEGAGELASDFFLCSLKGRGSDFKEAAENALAKPVPHWTLDNVDGVFELNEEGYVVSSLAYDRPGSEGIWTPHVLKSEEEPPPPPATGTHHD